MVHNDKDPTLRSLLLQEALAERGLYKGDLDNWWGTKSEQAYKEFLATFYPTSVGEWHECVASIFADPSDIAAFKLCKRNGGYWANGVWHEGNSDTHCFNIGDNGVGYWGAITTNEDDPICALPPEVIVAKWGSVNGGRRKLVEVEYQGRIVAVRLDELMPHIDNINNGAGIDLNPGAAKKLNLPEGAMVKVKWKWQA